MHRLLVPIVLFAASVGLLLPSVATVSAQSHFLRLPAQVNLDGQSELAPVVSVDGKNLYFTRSRMGADGELVFDIWRTEMKSDTEYTRAEIIGGNLSSRFGIAVTSISPDQNVLYLMGKLYEATPPDERIYRSVMTRTGWEIPKPVKINALRPRGVFTDYSFGPDQRTLVMSVERDSSMGGRDLYISFYNDAEDAWSEPRWLGSRVNSIYNEITPFLAPDGKTLYFSSERPNGIGECDVYRVTRKDDTWQNWTYPENLGPEINRQGRTMYYTQDAQGRHAYFVWRANEYSYTDIYRADLSQTRERIATTLIEGKVSDERGKPIDANIRYYAGNSNVLLGVARSNPNNGEFRLTLPAGATYRIHAERIGYTSTEKQLVLEHDIDFAGIGLDLQSLQVGTAVRMSNIFFETDRSVLYASSFAELDKLYQFMMDDPMLTIAVEGHTDDVGSDAHNKDLSLARANAVRDYLVSKGIAKSRIMTEGYGASKPTTENIDDVSRAINRRVEFKILSRNQ